MEAGSGAVHMYSARIFLLARLQRSWRTLTLHPLPPNNAKSENTVYLVGFCDTLAVGDPGRATYDPCYSPAE